MELSSRRVPPELVLKLNVATLETSLKDVIVDYRLSVIDDYSSYITEHRDGVEVYALSTNGLLLVYRPESEWELITEKEWINRIWEITLNGYTEETKLNFIRTIPHLKDYTTDVTLKNDLPLKLFVWDIITCDPNEYFALARTELEAKYIISKELGHYPEDLKNSPIVYTKAAAIVRIGERHD